MVRTQDSEEAKYFADPWDLVMGVRISLEPFDLSVSLKSFDLSKSSKTRRKKCSDAPVAQSVDA